MKSDIVERLREHGDCEIKDIGKWVDFASLYLAEAADEIERLRSALPEGMEHCKIIFEECEAGHGRLRGDNWLKKECPWCKIKEQAADIERLRAALEEVRVLVFGANHSEARYPLARAALEGRT